MCRIYGYFGRGFDAPLMDAARDAQLPGGPDHQQYVTGDGWGLGCNRLSIQDRHSGFQPFANTAGSVHLVFNGEIYNFRAIRAELAGHGIRVDGDCDGSVLLPYYELHGDDFVDRLEGMFAIALVDLRSRPRLKLWCDGLAVKSVYYTVTDGGVAFASEIRGLAGLLKQPLGVNPYAIDDYLNWQCLHGRTSLYEGVSALLPGERLTYDVGAVLWQQPQHRGPAPGDCSATGLRALLAHEVAQMSIPDGPIAVQLSGGLDSSLLATLLAGQRDDVTAFHVTHEGDHPSDELVFARAAAAHAGIPLQVVEVRQAELPGRIIDTVAALGNPNATPHAVSAYTLFQAIGQGGFRVCFVGDGADEQFGGYRRYSTALAERDETWPSRYLDRLSLVPETEYRRLYTPEYRDLLDSGVTSRQRAEQLLRRPAPSRLEQILNFDRLHKLPSLNLRKLDHLSMAHSVEGRVPYCQPAVTRFARHTPDTGKVDGARRKQILWDAGVDLIPPAVRDRAKQPFTFPVDAFMARSTALWDFVVDVLSHPRLCSSGYLDRTALRALVDDHAADGGHSRLLWGLMMLELALP